MGLSSFLQNSIPFFSVLFYFLWYKLINTEELLWVRELCNPGRQKWKTLACTSALLVPDWKWASLGPGLLLFGQGEIREGKKATKNQDQKLDLVVRQKELK